MIAILLINQSDQIITWSKNYMSLVGGADQTFVRMHVLGS